MVCKIENKNCSQTVHSFGFLERTIQYLGLAALLVFLHACSEQQSQVETTTAIATPDANSAPPAAVETNDEDEPEVDAAFRARQPTSHWTNDQPIGNGEGPVSLEMLAAGNANPEWWLHFGGDYRNFRHSPVTELNPDSISSLEVAWSFPTGTDMQFSVSPIVYDGIMYVTTSYNHILALNAATGELYWRYDHPQPDDLRLCCGPANRGAAISGDMIIMATLDAHMLAFDRFSGEILWDIEIDEYSMGFSATAAPLIVKNSVIIGIGGGEVWGEGLFRCL